MGACQITSDELKKYLPARILSLGYPDHLEGYVDLKGSTLESVDIFAHRGKERIVDLSYAVDLGQYDVVIDFGTIEHCANPAQAFINAASAVKVDGVIIHHLPLSMTNHGYWNLCPVWFTDFYKQNGFKIERFDMTSNATFFDGKIIPWPTKDPNENMFTLGEARLILCVARRVSPGRIFLPKCQEQWLEDERRRNGK